MTKDFEVINVVWHHNRGDFIFARHLGKIHNFPIPDGTLLGDIAIYHYEAMRSIKDEQGILHEDLFVFRPMSLQKLAENHFKKGQRVTLYIL